METVHSCTDFTFPILFLTLLGLKPGYGLNALSLFPTGHGDFRLRAALRTSQNLMYSNTKQHITGAIYSLIKLIGA
jgi:hypothetical protein